MSTLVAQTISNGTVSTSSANVIQGSAKAWVRFTVSGTTPTISSSYNISSVTYTSTGLYAVSFTNALPNANYAGVCMAITPGTAAGVGMITTTISTTGFGFTTVRVDTSGPLQTFTNNAIAIFSA
jgi:hypothetical protein